MIRVSTTRFLSAAAQAGVSGSAFLRARGRAPAHHRPLAIPGRMMPAPGVRAAPPVLRGRQGARSGAGGCRVSSWFPGFEEKRASILQVVELFRGWPELCTLVHELAEQRTAGMGVRAQRLPPRQSTRTRSRWRARFTARNLVLGTGGTYRISRGSRYKSCRVSSTSPAWSRSLITSRTDA